ncbi:phosphatidylcholine synthase [Brucella suis]|nr:phosphatidylcholine synthase [Brucella suis]SPU76375.1 phosphatidylcholine synthase [Brucella suis]
MVVFMLFIVRPGEWVAFGTVVASAILSFLPINFLHPVRVVRLRPLNLTIFLLWCAFGVIALYYMLDAPLWVRIGISVTGLYIYFIGAIMQLFPSLGREAALAKARKLVEKQQKSGEAP